MKKKGIGHIEMILSFLIFVIAVGTALYFFSPSDSTRLVDSSLTYALNEINKNTTKELDVFSVKINNLGIVGDTIALDISGVGPEKKVMVESGGGRLDSMRNGNFVFVRADDWSGIDFISVKFSEDFVESSGLSATYDENFYEILSSDTKEIISEKGLEELENYYTRHYAQLKEDFNLPGRIGFGFTFSFSDGTSIDAMGNMPDGFEVFSETERMEILRANGEEEFGELNVRIW